MTNIFSRTNNRQTIVTAGDLPELESKPALGQYGISFDDDDNIVNVFVRNQKGYKNLVLSVDEFNESGKRIRIDAVDNSDNVTASVFVGAKALQAFSEAAQLLADYAS
jgi:hypothetical protein